MNTTQIIATKFVATLREWLTAEEFAEMKVLNETDPTYKGDCCASHDFCDANVAMADAFAEVMGHQVDGDNEADCKVWNDAWELARAQELGTQAATV